MKNKLGDASKEDMERLKKYRNWSKRVSFSYKQIIAFASFLFFSILLTCRFSIPLLYKYCLTAYIFSFKENLGIKTVP